MGGSPVTPSLADPPVNGPAARLAIHPGFNVEHFAFGEGLGAGIGPASSPPDGLNYSWREYGNRVGHGAAWSSSTSLACPAAH